MLIKWLKKDVIAIAVLVVMPLILPCLFGWLLGNLYVEQIPFGVVDLDNSALSRQIIRGMEDHPGLDVVFVENQHTLEEQIYSKNLYGGMVIPTDFYKNLTGKHPKDLLTLIDGTNTLIASNTMGYVSAVTNTYGAGVMLSLLEAQGMTAPVATHTYNTFQYVERTLYDPYLSYMSFLLYFVMPYVMQIGFVGVFAVPLFAALRLDIQHGGWRTLRPLLMTEILVRCFFVYFCSAIASWTGFCLADYFFGLPLRGTMANYFILLGAFELALLAISMFLGTLLKPQHCHYVLDCLIVLGMVIFMTSGAVWLPYLMPEGTHQAVGCIWPFSHVALSFKYLNMKGAGLDILMPAILNCLRYAAFWGCAAIAVTGLQRLWYLLRHRDETDSATVSQT